MKNLTKLIGIIALAAVIGFSLTSCKEPDDSSEPTLTGITAVYTGGSVAINTDLNSLKSNLTVTANYSDNTGKTLGAADYSLSGDLSTSGQKTVTVTYEGKTTSFNVTVSATPIDITYTVARADGEDGVSDTTGIVFTFSASFDSLNLTAADITVSGAAAKGASAALTGTGTSLTLAPITVNAAGLATVAIAKEGIEAGTKNLIVFKAGESAPVLTGITAVYTGTTAIYPSTPLNNLKAHLTVKAQYTGGGENTLSEHEYSLSGTLAVGTSTVTVTYTDSDGVTKTTTFDVTVTAVSSDKTLTGITLNTASVKKDYLQNEALNLSGLVVTANYSDSPSAIVTGYTTSPANGAVLDTAGIITVTVTYTEGTITRNNTFTVTVIDPAAGTPGLAYELITDGANANTYRVRKGTVTGGVIVIPATYEGLPVTEIGSVDDSYDNGAFYNTYITSVTIPESVTSIGQYAFRNCTGLTEITIPEGVTSIGNGAFQNCTRLTSVRIPEGVTSIGNSAFTSCSGLTSVTLPNSLTSIGENAFFDCSGLTNITIPESVTSIGNRAFSDCYSLTSITIPASVTAIGDGTFERSAYGSGSMTLTSVTFAEGSQLTTIGGYAFYNCTGLTEITIPEGVTEIGNSAFGNCTGLTEITIPESVTEIGNNAFGNCTGLTGITIPEGVTSIGDYAFSGCTNLNNIIIDNDKLTFTYNRSLLNIFPIDNLSVTFKKNVPDYALYSFWNQNNNTFLTSVTILEGVTSIGNSAFTSCNGLTSVTLPNSLTSIGNYAFGNCTNLTEITIPEGVTSIGNEAFYGCTGLTEITIPESVTTIGSSAFSSCTGLTSITIPEGVTTIGSSAFSSWTNAQTIYVNGYSSQTTADTAWGGSGWRSGCNAVIVYGVATEIVQLNRTVFLIGEQLNSLAVSVRYSNNITETVTIPAANITGFDSATTGTKTLTVTYRGLTATSTVTVVDAITITNTTEWNNAITQLNGANSSVTLTIGGSFNVAGSTANTFGTTSTGELIVTLKGSGTLSLSSNGNMLRIGANQTMIIDSENLILQGRSSNNASLVYVNGAAAQLELRYGTISGNTNNNTSSYSGSADGGGVYVGSGGTFTMSGGTISGNKAVNNNSAGGINNSYGGGVYAGGATFTMNGGTISGNEASATAGTATEYPYARSYGGGVYVGGATFTMNGGTINGNRSTAIRSNSQSTNQAYGGGVCVGSGTFRIVTGTVSGTVTANSGSANGAALYGTAQRGTFSGETWVSAGTVSTTNNTISVVNGALQ
jgi:hypothetical protein